jgi:hypothetical protein
MIAPVTETALPLERPRRFHFDWVLPALFRPRPTFAQIVSHPGDVWLTPILILVVASLVRVMVAGWLKQAAAASGQITLPPDFQFWSPDQQAQFMQAASATSGPVFVYVFPAILATLGIWLGWLVMVGVLHLVLTLMGGRGTTRSAMNLVAWASLPFAVRELVRAGYMLATRQLVGHPGLSGFAPADGGALSLFLAEVLGLVDVYLIWSIMLFILGIRGADTLSAGKAVGGVLITILVVLLLQAIPGFVASQFSNLTIIRPFFF